MQRVQINAVVPIFPGTNCEYDTATALTRSGFAAVSVVIRNLTPDALAESAVALVEALNRAHVLVIPGGFSGGDEPEGSAKLIAAFFRNPRVTDATHTLLQQRGGLVLGICNGFQALIKLGLVPYGEIRTPAAGAPTLAFNHVGRHIAKYVTTRVVSNTSPWLCKCEVGAEYVIPISHGEGRFTGVVPQEQVATVYADNPNGSDGAVEGITSPDGHVYGKMGHSERVGRNVAKNIAGNKEQPIFESAFYYFH